MSIITAIFQAIGQALTWIFPMSESGHSSIFHDFSSRLSGNCSELTGLVHIGIAIGFIFAFYKLFIRLANNFFGGWNDLLHKRLKIKEAKPMRQFMFMTILSFSPMILYLIPAGKYGFFYGLVSYLGRNGTLLDEGICFVVLGVLVFFANQMIKKSVNNKRVDIISAVILGFSATISLPLSGLSCFGVVFCMALLLGMSKKTAVWYASVMSVPSLIVMGIIEICTAVTYVNIFAGIIGVVLSIASTYLFIKLFVYLANKAQLTYFSYYDMGIGVICFFIGIIELAIE